ncbi:MAG: DUF1552 domain-containing protein [Acidimicrobiia bacterium]|nr:DUF1552 domain-containing protein [Acidimicrobiia bacterium]
MMITRKALSRRTVLRGIGATIALPLLDGMVPALSAQARTAAAPKARFGFVYVPHGSIMNQWTPAQEGAGFEFSTILKPLERFREDVNVYTNLDNRGENGHSPSTAMFLSGVFPPKGTVIKLGTTVDQYIAQHIGRETAFPSLEFATEDHSTHLGSCAGDFLCAYMSTISWASPTQPLPMEINPRVVFERLFGSDRSSVEERKARLEANTSILDAVTESANELKRVLGATDRTRVTEYLDNVREIERRIVAAEKQRELSGVEVPPTPVGIPENWTEHATLMFDLQAIALQADLTRVISFMLSRELSTLSYPEIGVADGHHPISHNNGVPEQVAKKIAVDMYHLVLFSNFLDKLKAMPEGDSNVFENSLFFYGSGMSNGNQHTHDNLPVLTVGGAAGKMKSGTHYKTPKGTPLANLHLALLEKAGAPIEKFGIGEVGNNGMLSI